MDAIAEGGEHDEEDAGVTKGTEPVLHARPERGGFPPDAAQELTDNYGQNDDEEELAENGANGRELRIRDGKKKKDPKWREEDACEVGKDGIKDGYRSIPTSGRREAGGTGNRGGQDADKEDASPEVRGASPERFSSESYAYRDKSGEEEYPCLSKEVDGPGCNAACQGL